MSDHNFLVVRQDQIRIRLDEAAEGNETALLKTKFGCFLSEGIVRWGRFAFCRQPDWFHVSGSPKFHISKVTQIVCGPKLVIYIDEDAPW